MKNELLFEEYREGILECVHYGTVCVTDGDRVVACVGDPDFLCFYRSASKPIQALPVLMAGLPEKYGLTEAETVLLSSSHWGDEEHEEACLSIMGKAGLREEDMIMLPTYPNRLTRRNALISAGKAPRKIWHNCSGKHLALMMLARELNEDVRDYWKRDSRTQAVVRKTVAALSGAQDDEIAVGVDGCGVPVFAVPMHKLADSYANLVCPERISDRDLRAAVIRNTELIHRHPTMLSGQDTVCSIVSADPDLLGKSGALGVYALGIRSKGLGISAKISDGSQEEFGALVIAILQKLGIAPGTVDELNRVYPDTIINDNLETVGERKTVFAGKLTL